MAVSTLGTVVSVRIGRARSHPSPDWDRGAAREWRTAYWKDEATGAVRIGTLVLEGDEQADRRVHGGAHMAVLMYAETHYALWRTLPGLAGMGTGGFGENLTLDGADERELCIGDVLEVGGAELEISSPRGPCANISRRWDAPWLLARVVERRRIGWRRLQRPHTGWTIERLLRLRYVTPRAIDELAEASSLGALAPEWQKRFAKLASQG